MGEQQENRRVGQDNRIISSSISAGIGEQCENEEGMMRGQNRVRKNSKFMSKHHNISIQ